MSIEWHLHRSAQVQAAAAARDAAARGERVPLDEQWQPLAAELEAFYRELPALLADGEEGRIAVVHGGRVESVWDTPRDADQHAHGAFGAARFLVIRVDAGWLDSLSWHFGPLAESESTT